MGTLTAQILAGKAHLSHGGIVPTHIKDGGVKQMETIVVVGGNKSVAGFIEQFDSSLQVLFHDAHVKSKKGQRKLEDMLKKADRVVVMVDACSHQSMWGARTAAKQQGIPIHYNKGLGISGFLNAGHIFS
jgi:hypothetical protein